MKKQVTRLLMGILLGISLFLHCERAYADNEGVNEEFEYKIPPVLTVEELNEYNAKIRKQKYEIEGKESYKDHKLEVRTYILYDPEEKPDYMEALLQIYPFLSDEKLYVLAPTSSSATLKAIERLFASVGYTEEQHEELLKKYNLPNKNRPRPVETTAPQPTTADYGTEEKPLVVNFKVPEIVEAKDLVYKASKDSKGVFNQLQITGYEQMTEEKRETLDTDGTIVSADEHPGLNYYLYSVNTAIIVHDPQKVFGYEWLWAGGREQTVYNGMNEAPDKFLASLKRGIVKITIKEDALRFTNILLEEKTTGLFYSIPVQDERNEITLYLDLPASEYYLYVDDKVGGEGQNDLPGYDTLGSGQDHSKPFVGLIDHVEGPLSTSNVKLTVSESTPIDVVISYDESEDIKGAELLAECKKAAAENSELLVYDFIHADRLLPDQSSYALYKLAKAYDKSVPEGYYKQYLTSFEYLNADAVLPIDVKTDVQDLFETRGDVSLPWDKGFLSCFIYGSVYTNGDKSKQMYYVYGKASTDAAPKPTLENLKNIEFAYPMDIKTRVCGEMISAYDNPEMFGYKKGDLDERAYAFQVLRCCSDLYQYTSKDSEWDMGVQMRFRYHMVKDPSQISGERMVYDRTVCQYLPESVIKYISSAASMGVLMERDHSTPANSSSLWWEPLKKEPLGEIHLTEKDNATITWPEYKEPIVERKDGSEIETPPASSEQETNVEKSSVEESSTEKDTREYKTMEYVEKEPSSFNPATLIIIIIISVFVIAAVIGAVVVIKAKKKGNGNHG